MRSSRSTQSTTSLPQSPRDEESSRIRAYLITMGVRVACFILMVAVMPYGWWTFAFGVGAIFLPYVAVVLANVGQDTHIPAAEDPQRVLEAAAPAPASAPSPEPLVIRISETGRPGTGS